MSACCVRSFVSGLIMVGTLFFPGVACSRECFAVYSDSQGNDEIHRQIVAMIGARHPDFVFHMGDMVENSDVAEEWADFKNVTAPLRRSSRFFAVAGNHDGVPQYSWSSWGYPAGKPWYSVVSTGNRFIFLGTNFPLGEGSPQWLWLEQQLSGAAHAGEAPVVFMHHPLLTASVQPGPSVQGGAAVFALLERYRVPIIFSGHEHAYERFDRNGLVYVVTGGGGGRLLSAPAQGEYLEKFSPVFHYSYACLEDPGLKVRVFDLQDHLIDEFNVSFSGDKERERTTGQ